MTVHSITRTARGNPPPTPPLPGKPGPLSESQLSVIALALTDATSHRAVAFSSWEASFVDQLVKGTVGYDDGFLPGPTGNRRLTDAKARQIQDRYAYDEVTQRDLAAEFGVSPSTISDIATGKAWRWLA